MVDLSIVFCKRLPEGTLWLFNIAMEAMARENGWFSQRIKPAFSFGIFQFAMLNNRMVTINGGLLCGFLNWDTGGIFLLKKLLPQWVEWLEFGELETYWDNNQL